MTYTTTITRSSLRIRESRIIADLLLQGVSDEQWTEAIVEQNILQMGSVHSIKKTSALLRARLEPLGAGLWTMVRDGGRELATQATFAGAVKNSRLLGDFLDVAIRVLREHEPEEVECEHALFACVRCNTVHNRFNYRIVYDDGRVVEPQFRCGSCRGKLVRTTEDIGQYSCGRCGARALTLVQDMLWD